MIVFTVIFFIIAIKVVFTLGIDAPLNSYLSILQNTSIAEAMVWFALAIAIKSFFDKRSWYYSTFTLDVSTCMEQMENGEMRENISERFSSSIDYESAKKAYLISKIAVIFSSICFVLINFF